MSKIRNWLNPPERLLDECQISSVEISSIYPTREETIREALLSLGDFAYNLKPGQFMVVQRHNPNTAPLGRLFTVKIYKSTEEKLYE